jgi:hypothetical protein
VRRHALQQRAGRLPQVEALRHGLVFGDQRETRARPTAGGPVA